MTKTPTERLYKIVEDGMCIGCGICQAIATPRVIQVTKTDSGYEHPVVTGELDHETVDKIYDICPGTRLVTLPDHLMDEKTKFDPLWGPYRRIEHAWAGDPDIRFRASTGGLLTALGCHLLDTGKVDFILHAKASQDEPTFGIRQISYTSADVVASMGSRYGPTAPLIDIDEVLDRGKPFAVIAKPCDITALRNYARHEPRVETLVRYWLGIICGGWMAPDETERFIRSRNVDPKDVTSFRYRGMGCPGRTHFETKDGRVEEARMHEFWGTENWQLPWRCKVCPEGSGETADLAAGDAWPDGGNTQGSSFDEDRDPGTNIVVVRTTAGEELMDAAIESGHVTLGSPGTVSTLSFYNPHHVNRTTASGSRLEGMRLEGMVTPTTEGLNLEVLDQRLTEEARHEEIEGTRKRIRMGKAALPTPSFPENN